MKFSNYRKLDHWERATELRKFYKEIAIDRHITSDSDIPFEIVVWERQKVVSPIWRLTLLIWPVYYILACIFLLIKWLLTGNSGLPRKWLDKVHYPWAKKLKL